MQSFYLLDGSMILQTLNTLESFNLQSSTWLRILAPHSSMGLAAPLLIAPELAHTQRQMRDIARAKHSFPQQLHCSQLQSSHSLEALAAHLGQFAYFLDDSGDRYGLRLADCRVLHYLPRILSSEWKALSAPIDQWIIGTRDGKGRALALEQSQPPVSLTRPFSLDGEQIHQLAEAGEADSLLANLGRPPENTPLGQIQQHYETASKCLRIWERLSQGNPEQRDRRVLMILTRRVFASNAVWIDDMQRITNELQQITSSLSSTKT